MNEPLGNSNYHSAYFQVEHRFAHGFSFLANYTLSKLMEDAGGIEQSPGSNRSLKPIWAMSDIYGLAPFRCDPIGW